MSTDCTPPEHCMPRAAWPRVRGSTIRCAPSPRACARVTRRRELERLVISVKFTAVDTAAKGEAMNRHVARLTTLILLTSFVLSGCAAPAGQQPTGLQMLGRGVATLMLAPVMIVAGIAQGLAFLPYTIGTKLSDLNRALVEADAV